jgi:hypothetical protein
MYKTWSVLMLLTDLLPSHDHAAEDTNAATPEPGSNGRLGEIITIPAGTFLMGNNSKEGYDNPDEIPPHWIELPTCQIGKYEVTRGQYRKFIEAGGYKSPQYWSAEGWKWKPGNTLDYAGMHGQVTRATRPALRTAPIDEGGEYTVTIRGGKGFGVSTNPVVVGWQRIVSIQIVPQGGRQTLSVGTSLRRNP